jgi:hypothetical protein
MRLAPKYPDLDLPVKGRAKIPKSKRLAFALSSLDISKSTCLAVVFKKKPVLLLEPIVAKELNCIIELDESTETDPSGSADSVIIEDIR